MEIKYGTRVIDKNNQILGRVDHLVWNAWTGEVRKFVVNREAEKSDLFLSPQDVMEVTSAGIKLKHSLNEIKGS